MKTRHTWKLASAALAFASFGITGAAIAAGQAAMSGGDTGGSFQSLDKNSDGHLTRSEIPTDMPLLRSRFSTYDGNQDGSLDAREFAVANAALQGGGHAGEGSSGAPPQHKSSSEPTGG